MSFSKIALILLSTVLFSMSAAIASDSEKAAVPSMPPMGPPPQMKDISFLVGDWDVAMKMNMGDTSDNWVESKGTCKYTNIIDGCAIQMFYEGEFGGMKFAGTGITCYDRETGKWQSAWIDNMGARIGLYEGDRVNGVMTLTAKDRYAGQQFLSRNTTYNETEKSFDWKMETSRDDGKTWKTMGLATYTKRQ